MLYVTCCKMVQVFYKNGQLCGRQTSNKTDKYYFQVILHYLEVKERAVCSQQYKDIELLHLF